MYNKYRQLHLFASQFLVLISNFLATLQPDASCLNGSEKTRFWCQIARFVCLYSAREQGSIQCFAFVFGHGLLPAVVIDRDATGSCFPSVEIQLIGEMLATNVHDIGIFSQGDKCALKHRAISEKLRFLHRQM